jgi:hypothetical protein
MPGIIDYVANEFGWERERSSPIMDVVKELSAGKLIFVDADIHSPVQRWMREISFWDEFINEKAVEIRAWSSLLGYYHNRETFIRNLASARDDRLKLFGKRSYQDFSEEITDETDFVRQVALSMDTVLKTVIEVDDRHEDGVKKVRNILIAAIAVVKEKVVKNEQLPLFMIELMFAINDESVRALIRQLHDLGARIVVIRLVGWPTTISDMPADIHIVERTPFLSYLRNEAEVLLRDGTYATVHPFFRESPKGRWGKKDRLRPVPSFDEYNADPEQFKALDE